MLAFDPLWAQRHLRPPNTAQVARQEIASPWFPDLAPFPILHRNSSDGIFDTGKRAFSTGASSRTIFVKYSWVSRIPVSGARARTLPTARAWTTGDPSAVASNPFHEVCEEGYNRFHQSRHQQLTSHVRDVGATPFFGDIFRTTVFQKEVRLRNFWTSSRRI